jgi:soluble lytic murein transglycosylase
MQFISTTADRIALDLGRTDFEQDELFDPRTAILFGSKYIGDLFGHFPELPEAVAASYNGGEDNMKRWLGRSRSREADRYVPEIAFSQSKDYVHRVMSSYRMYTELYDERLNRK